LIYVETKWTCGYVDIIVLQSFGVEVEKITRELRLRWRYKSRKRNEVKKLGRTVENVVPKLPLEIGTDYIFNAAFVDFNRMI